MSDPRPSPAPGRPPGLAGKLPLSLKGGALAALLAAGVALIATTPAAQGPAPGTPPPAAQPPTQGSPVNAAGPPLAPTDPLIASDPSIAPPEDDDAEDVASGVELAPRAAVTAEPLVPVEILVEAELAPRAPLSDQPLVPVEIFVDAELAPRAPVSTAPLVPHVIVDQ